MRGRWAVNLMLLVLVALLSGLVQRELEQERRLSRLTELDPAGIEELRLERPGEEAISLVRGVSGWRMEAPYRTRANGARVVQLLGVAATQVFRSLPEAGAGSRLGLEPPRAMLTLDGLGLRFGDIDPITQRRYVGVGGQVHLIGDGFHHHVTAPPEAFVSPRLLPLDFSPAAGTLSGEPLREEALNGLTGLTAERVLALGNQIGGRLLSLSDPRQGTGLRFLISGDGQRWARLDLRLVYVLAEPPSWVAVEGGGLAGAQAGPAE